MRRRTSGGRQTDDDLVALVRRQLEPLPLTVRGMFGGRGLYLEGKYFGAIFGGRLYFRSDVESRDDYLSRGMTALQPKSRPRGPKTVDRNFEVPPDVLADASLLKEWALRAARVAR